MLISLLRTYVTQIYGWQWKKKQLIGHSIPQSPEIKSPEITDYFLVPQQNINVCFHIVLTKNK